LFFSYFGGTGPPLKPRLQPPVNICFEYFIWKKKKKNPMFYSGKVEESVRHLRLHSNGNSNDVGLSVSRPTTEKRIEGDL
jgi:hypothetical protein